MGSRTQAVAVPVSALSPGFLVPSTKPTLEGIRATWLAGPCFSLVSGDLFCLSPLQPQGRGPPASYSDSPSVRPEPGTEGAQQSAAAMNHLCCTDGEQGPRGSNDLFSLQVSDIFHLKLPLHNSLLSKMYNSFSVNIFK